MTSIVRQLLDVPSTDPDNQRRARLLNILLLGTATLTLLTLSVTAIADAIGEIGEPGIIPLYLGGLTMLAGIVIIFLINRYWRSWLASSLFLLLVTIVFALSDEPQEIANGRTLIAFVVPIVIASVLLPPYASFIVASLNSAVITIVALNVHIVPNPFAMIIFAVIALVSWLSARSLERALAELRAINRDLDQRVEERTREVAEALGKNQAVLEGIADGVIVFDNDNNAIVANPALARLLGRPAHEIVGCSIETLMGKDVAAEDQEVILDLLGNRQTHFPSIKFEWGDKTLSVSIASVGLDSGETIGTVAVFRDFTREAEIDRMKSSFVSIASHELRTPLSAILGYADILQEGVHGPLSEKQRSTLERIVVNTGHLLNLVNNLLDQARIEAGTLTLNVAPFVLADLIDDVQGVMDVLAQAKGLTLVSHIADGVSDTLFGDRQRLHQILINLVSNAVKFTDEGTVHIHAYRPDVDHWALKVSDSGHGIPPEAQAHVFEPFRQADDSLTREHTGAGLGLAIVKQLTDLMSGEITLKSVVGHGSTFTVVLPLVPPAWTQPRGVNPKGLSQNRRSHQ